MKTGTLLSSFKKLEEVAKDHKAEPGLHSFLDQMVETLNGTTKQFPIKQLSGQIIEVTMAAGTEVRISHLLGSVPKYRIILGQSGNGVISDAKGKDANGTEKWTKKFITLKNNGASAQDIIVLVCKE